LPLEGPALAYLIEGRLAHTGRHVFGAERMESSGVEEAAVLGLEPGEADPVRIIFAAHLRLRCCRQDHSAAGDRPAGAEVRRIIAARDSLLQQAAGTLAGRGLGR
jgi:hypothetical protein